MATKMFADEPAADAVPTENLYVPGAHIAGKTVPGLTQLNPGGHGRHTPDPWEGAKVLLLQLYAWTDPAPPTNCPRGASTGAVLPDGQEYPGGHIPLPEGDPARSPQNVPPRHCSGA